MKCPLAKENYDMKSFSKRKIRLVALTALLLAIALISGCAGSPDSVQDPLAQYDTNVNALVPFATSAPTPAATWYADPVTTPPAATATPEPGGYADIQYGQTDDAVSALQGRLKALGYYNGQLDSKYGDSTASAVRLFQSQLGVSVTGLATASLQRMLFSTSAPRYNSGNAGSSNADSTNYDDDDGYDDVDDFDPYVTPQPTKKPTPKPTTSGYAKLAKGDKGSAVSSLQRSLKELGYYSGSVDGDYGSATVTAVKRFQRMYGQSQTGVATAAMQKKLFSGDAVEYVPPTTPKPTNKPTPEPDDDDDDDKYNYVTLKPGNSGAKVKTLQKRLKALGYFNGEIGGNYLELTTAAVKLFQKTVGMEQTGTATVATQRKLFADDAPKYKPKATPTPVPSKYTQLKEGSSGSAVKKLQQRLKDLGYYSGSVTGGYGKNTTAAVKLFQKDIDQKQSGTATTSMQKILYSDDAPSRKNPVVTPEPSTYTKLKPGSTGTKVKALQKRLKALGYFDGDIGGNYLTKTTAAVKAFQKAIGVKQDGIATVDLQEKLFSEDAPSKGASGSSGLKALKYKDTGDAVYELQLRLIELGFMSDFNSDSEGTYGKETRQAVIDAQLERGFDTDGNADLEFMRFIMSDKAYNISRNEHGG